MSKRRISVEWTGEGLSFTGRSPNGVTLTIDGEQQAGNSPMVLLLHAEAGCTAIDVLEIMRKMRQTPSGLRVEVEAERGEGDFPKVWEKIHLRYRVSGDVAREGVERAIGLSLEKYCSVSAMLGKTAEITWELVLES